MANPWDADPIVTAAPAAAPTAMPWDKDEVVTPAPAVAAAGPKPFPDGLGGEMPDGSATRDPAVWARWTAQATPAAPPSAPAKTGLLANIGAGLQEGGAAVVNAMADPVGNLIAKPAIAVGTGAYNLGARMFGYQPISAQTIGDLLDDHGTQIGDRAVAALDHAGGAPAPAEVAPADGGERYARAMAQGAAGMATLSPAGVALGAATGVGAQAGADLAPDDLKPLASLAGGVAAGAVTSGIGRTAQGVANVPLNALADFAAPAMGPKSPLLDAAGAPIMSAGANPVPLMASANQAHLAGLGLEAAASDPAAVRASLANMAAPAVPGVQPTLFQATRDPGLGQLENGLAKMGGPDASAAFRGRADAQNDARVQSLADLASAADPAAVPTEMRRQAADIDTTYADRAARIEAQANASVDQARTSGQAQTAALQTQAGQALNAIGGDLPAGADAQAGAALRAPIDAANQAAKTRESALWNAIDPDGTLALATQPTVASLTEAQKLVGAIQPSGNEATIMKAIGNLPPVAPLKTFTDIRSDLTTTMRGAKVDPERAKEHARLSIMLQGVHDAMDNALADRQAGEDHAVQAGVMQPEDTMMARWQAEANAFRAARQQAAVGGSSGGSAGNSSRSGSAGISGSYGAEAPTRGGLGNAAGAAGLQGQEPLTPNFDAAAAERYAAARAATAERAATFKTAPGVGQALQSGPISGTFRTPDSAVPNVIVKVGPQGADAARAYLAAGGSPAQLADAAAFSLRQAAMKDGVLDPAKTATWMQQRQSFLSQIPDAAQRFGAAADAQRALVDGTKASDARVAEATKLATQSINDATARRAAAVKEYQDSVAGKFLGGADPVRQVGSILRSATAETDMGKLAQLVSADPDAKAGLQRAVVEHILSLRGDAVGPTSASAQMHSAAVQKAIRTYEPALQKVLAPKQMQTLKNVAQSMQDSQMSASGTLVGTNSPTAQNLANGHAAGGSFLSTFGNKVVMAGATGGAAIAGSLIGGVPGTIAGVGAGAAAAAFQAMREAGIKNIHDLTVQAALNPELARVLLTKATPQNRASLTKAFTASLKRIALVSSQERTR